MWKTANGTIIHDFKSKIVQLIKKPKNIKIVVGCDSQVIGDKVYFVSAIIVLDVGCGGNFIYNRQCVSNETSLKIIENRLFQETLKSVQLAKKLDQILYQYDLSVDQIHIDVNSDKKYKSNKVLNSCVGLIVGSGYTPVVKPNAYAASDVADSLTR